MILRSNPASRAAILNPCREASYGAGEGESRIADDLLREGTRGEPGASQYLGYSDLHRLRHWPTAYSSASVSSESSGCAVPPTALDHCAVASTSASCGSPVAAGTNFATGHRCAASLATDSPAHRFSALEGSSSPARSPSRLPNPPARERRIPRSSTRSWIAWLRSESGTASANRP